MIKLSLPKNGTKPFNVLCLGAHADDIEIGCGGTLLYFAGALPQVRFHWIVLSTPGVRRQEANQAAELFARGRNCEIILKDFRDGFFPYSGAELKEVFEEIKDQVTPDLIFTPRRGDAHQDHRLVAELTWNTFRNHLILEYEIPKFDGDLGQPNVFVQLETPLYEEKVDYLFKAFQSQNAKPWFDRAVFLGLMRIRGMESNSASGYAEGFYARKVVVHHPRALHGFE